MWVLYIHKPGWSVRWRLAVLSFLFPFFFLKALFPILRSVCQDKISNYNRVMGQCAVCELINSSRFYSGLVLPLLCVSVSPFGNLRPPWVLGSQSDQLFCMSAEQVLMKMSRFLYRDGCKVGGLTSITPASFLVAWEIYCQLEDVPFSELKALMKYLPFYSNKHY